MIKFLGVIVSLFVLVGCASMPKWESPTMVLKDVRLWEIYDRPWVDINKELPTDSLRCAMAAYSNVIGFVLGQNSAEMFDFFREKLPNESIAIQDIATKMCEWEYEGKEALLCPYIAYLIFYDLETMKIDIWTWMTSQLDAGYVLILGIVLTEEDEMGYLKAYHHVLTVYGYEITNKYRRLYFVDSDDEKVMVHRTTYYEDTLGPYIMSVKGDRIDLLQVFGYPIFKGGE